MSISSCYAFFKTYHEYIPIVSTGTSLVKIFKAVYLHQDYVFAKTHCYTSLRKKAPLRILVLLIPGFGNFLIGIYDFKKFGDNHLTLSTLHLDGLSLKYASENAQNSKKIVRVATLQNPKAFQFASNELKSNLQYVRKLMEIDISVLSFASDDIRKNQPIILEMIQKHHINVLYYADTEVQNDEHLILSLIKEYSSVLKYCDKLRINEAFIYSLIQIDPAYFKHAHSNLRNDRIFVSKLMRADIRIFGVASDEIRLDVGFVEEQMKILSFDVLKYSLLGNDKNYISKKINTDLSLFQHAGDDIRNAKEFIIQHLKTIPYAHKNIRTDIPFIIKCIQEHGLSLEWLDESLRNNPEVILSFVKRGSYEELKWMSDDLKENAIFAETLALIDGELLYFFSNDIQDKPKLLFIALKTSEKPREQIRRLLNQNDFSLKKDRYFFLEVIKINPAGILLGGSNLQYDESFMFEAIEQTPEVLKYSVLLSKETFVFELVKKGFLNALLYAPMILRNNKIFITKLLEVNENCFEFAGDELKKDKEFILLMLYKYPKIFQ